MNQPTTSAATLTEQEAIAIDLAMLEDKRNDGYGKRNQDKAMKLQLDYQLVTGEFL